LNFQIRIKSPVVL